MWVKLVMLGQVGNNIVMLPFAEDFEHPSVSESDGHAPEWEGQDGTGINSSGTLIW